MVEAENLRASTDQGEHSSKDQSEIGDQHHIQTVPTQRLEWKGLAGLAGI
jgi:hypothetical protein